MNVAGVVPRAGLTASQLFCGVSTLTTKSKAEPELERLTLWGAGLAPPGV